MKKPASIFNFSVTNLSNKKVVIHIDGEIVDASTQALIKAIFGDTTTTSYKSFRNEVDKLDAEEYDVILNCPGGHVGDALAIHDMIVDLQNKGKTVNTIGRGIVASAGTLILLSGKSPSMSENSWFMMHPVSGGTWGSVDQVENYAATMRKFNDKVRDMYVNKSGMRKEEVTKLMNAESWLTAQEALDKGLISEVEGLVNFENSIKAEDWQYEDTAILNSYNNSVKPSQTNTIEDMKKIIAKWGTDLMAAIKGIKPTAETTNEQLLESIGNVMQTSITALSDQMENSHNESLTNFMNSEAGKKLFTDQVTAIVNSEAGKKLITDQVTAAAANFVTKEDMNSEIEIIKGSGSTATGGTKEKEVVPIGGFVQN